MLQTPLFQAFYASALHLYIKRKLRSYGNYGCNGPINLNKVDYCMHILMMIVGAKDDYDNLYIKITFGFVYNHEFF